MLIRRATAATVLLLSCLLAAGCGDDSPAAEASPAAAASSGPPPNGEHYATARELITAAGCLPLGQDITMLVAGSVSAEECTGVGAASITAAIFGTNTEATTYATATLQVAKAAKAFLIGENWILRCTNASDCDEAKTKIGGQRLGG